MLGLDLDRQTVKKRIPEDIKKLMEKRENLRKARKFDEADSVRKEIEKKGYEVKDTSLEASTGQGQS